MIDFKKFAMLLAKFCEKICMTFSKPKNASGHFYNFLLGIINKLPLL